MLASCRLGKLEGYLYEGELIFLLFSNRIESFFEFKISIKKLYVITTSPTHTSKE